MEKWRTSDWWTSPYNYMEKVRAALELPGEVQIHDATLRDGEQTPGVVLRKEDKVRIARELDAFGVDRIEAGMPAVSEEDAEAVRAIAALGLNAKVMCFSRALVSDIELADKCGADGVVIEVPIGEPKLVHQFNWTVSEVLERSIQAIRRARELGLYTVYFPYDTTRSRPEALEELLSNVMREAPPDSIGVVDTTGCAIPEAITYLVRYVRELTGLPVEIHTHNDLGLGVANALSAVAAGAEVVHTCINGMGERTGNAALEEVALCLVALYGYKNRFNLEKLTEISELVQSLTGFKLAPNKPIVGKGNFIRESGIGADLVIKFPLAMFSLNPSLVGQRPRVVLGKKSGQLSIRLKLEELGLGDLDQTQMRQVLAEVKRRGIEKGGLVSDEEFAELVEQVRR